MELKTLERMTVIKLREEALKIPELSGVRGMSKEQLIRALASAHRIDLATPTNRALWPLLAAVLIGVAAFGLAGLLKRRPIGTSA